MSNAVKSTENKAIIRKGTFKIAPKAEKPMLLFLMGLVCCAIVLVLSFIDLGEYANSLIGIMLWVCLVMDLCAGILWLAMRSEKEYRFECLESEFVVTNDRGGREIFYYSDVRDISFDRFKSGISRLGYVVTITTGIRTVQYRCIAAGGRENTPFFWLGVNAGLLEAIPEIPVDKELILQQFETMQKEQIKKKGSKRIKSAEDFFNAYGDGEDDRRD